MLKNRNYSSEDLQEALVAIEGKIHIFFFNFYFLGGLSVGKAVKRYRIPKTTLIDRKNKHWETDKGERQTGLSAIEETSRKYYIDYMASINHSLSVTAVKAFACELPKKVTA